MTALDWTMLAFITIVVTIGLSVFIRELTKDAQDEEK